MGLLHLTLDLTQRRLAEAGAVEVVKGAVIQPTPAQTPGGEPPSERRYTLRERGLTQYVWEAKVVNWTGLLTNRPYKTANCEE